MIKTFAICLALFILLSCKSSAQQSEIELDFETYALDTVPKEVVMDTAIVSRIIAKMGGKKVVADDRFTKYKFGGFYKTFVISLSYESTVVPGKKIIGFTTYKNQPQKVSRNYSTFFLAAYEQEAGLHYKGKLVALPEKSKKEYWKRNLISRGYAETYLHKSNPFTIAKGFSIATGYFFDALGYSAIIGGALFGNTPGEKLSIPIFGLCFSLLYRGLIGWGEMALLNNYNRVAKSGYKVPKEILEN